VLFKAVKPFVGEKKFQDLRMTTSNTGSLRADRGKEIHGYKTNAIIVIIHE
jgi:hypothetical protein